MVVEVVARCQQGGRPPGGAPAVRDTKFKPKARNPLQPAGQQQKPAGQAEETSEREQPPPAPAPGTVPVPVPAPMVRLPTAGPCCPASHLLLLLPRGLGRAARFRLELVWNAAAATTGGRPP